MCTNILKNVNKMLNSNVKLWLQICLLNIMEFLLVWQHWQVWKDWTQYYHVYFSQGEQCWLYALAIQLCEITSHSFRWCQGHCGYTRMCCCCSPTSAFTSAFSSFALFQFLCHYYFICNYFRCSFSTNLLWRIFICHDASHNTHCITKMKIKR